MDSSEANIQLRINLTPLKLLVLGYFFSVDGKIQPGLHALQTKEERSNGWWRQLQKHTSYRRAALISANYRFSKGEMDSCQSERTHQTHQTVFRNMDYWTIWLSEIFRNVCWKGAERKNLPFLKRKNPPHHFRGALFRDDRVEYLQSWVRNDLLLAEVRLQNQTDGEISAFWNIWTKLRPVGVCGHAVNKVLA